MAFPSQLPFLSGVNEVDMPLVPLPETVLTSPSSTDAATVDLSSRRTSWMFVRALLSKNWLLKKRHRVATLLEVLLPTLFILLLGALKHLTHDVSVPSGWSDDTHIPGDRSTGTAYNLFSSNGTVSTWVPKELPKFNMHETSLSGLLISLGRQSFTDGVEMQDLSDADSAACSKGLMIYGDVNTDISSPYRVPIACADKVVPYKIGIAPDTTFTRRYLMETTALWYPRVALMDSNNSIQVPSFQESVHFFDTSDGLETCVSGKTYGKDLDHPKIYGAIVFDSYPSDSEIGTFTSIEYSLRLNSTLDDSGNSGRIPSTGGDPVSVDSFQRKIEVLLGLHGVWVYDIADAGYSLCDLHARVECDHQDHNWSLSAPASYSTELEEDQRPII